MHQRFRLAVSCTMAFALVAAAVACGGPSQSAPVSPPQSSTVRLAPQNVTTVATGRLSTGPVISGQLTPAREASVRAEVGA